MCGITGFWNSRQAKSNREQVLRRMIQRMAHRGPDASGTWCDDKTGIALGHARLSILELSNLGAQPMTSRCDRFVISYNGEIYNFGFIRDELAALGHSFRGGSDTEVVLAAIAEWGIENAVNRFVGMFAFVLWDKEDRSLTLCRDRVGIKPLYIGIDQGQLVFSSELKPFREAENFDLTINRNSLALYFRHNCIPAPHSIFQNVSKLRPGHILKITRADLEKNTLPESTAYWSVRDTVLNRGGGRYEGTPDEAVETLDRKLRDAVGCRMIADVPLGAFLSGGIDSSTVVALMQAQSDRPVKTFSIGFSQEGYNEAVHAAEVAKHIGTDHTELYVSEKEAQSVIPDLSKWYDEPFSDSSQIPTFLVSKLARKDVTVSLSGDGGDELFCGYNRYETGLNIWRKMSRIPKPGRRMISGLIKSRSPEQWDSIHGFLSPILPGKLQMRLPGNKAYKLADVLEFSQPEEMYRSVVSHWKNPADDLVIGAKEPFTNLTDPVVRLSSDDATFAERMMYLDAITYLPDDILTKVDRASMGVSLEARVPLLDHRVVEFAWSLPHDVKVRNGDTKWVLRKVLEKYVPRSLFDRPKMGFGIPLDNWLRTDLRDWAEDLLDEPRMRDEGFLNPGPVRELWKQHLDGKADWQYLLWDVLMFQAWMREYQQTA